jgi:hypothetical protein
MYAAFANTTPRSLPLNQRQTHVAPSLYGGGMNRSSVATLAAATAIALLAAGCSSGGGSSATPPAPTPTPTPSVANTSSSAYLPLYAGNAWTFGTGGKIVDAGSLTLSCTCPQNGKTFEVHDFYSPAGAYTGSFVIGKGAWPLSGSLQGHRITYLVGTTTNHGSTITLTFESLDGTVPGYPLMDDSPSSGEVFSLTSLGGNATTTFTSIGGIQPYGSSQIINNIADTIVTASGLSTPIAIAMAKGAGYTSISENNQTAQLSAFTINAAQSQSVSPSLKGVVIAGTADPARIAADAMALGRH